MAGSLKNFSLVNNDDELETYLRALFKTPKNRSMEEVRRRAQQIRDRLWRIRYINRGKAMLNQFDLAAEGKPSSK
jgi:hypothetical protein